MFEWLPLSLSVLFWLEFGVVALLSCLRILPAELVTVVLPFSSRAPAARNKRGAVSFGSNSVPFYVRNLAYLVKVPGLPVLAWIVVGALFVVPSSPYYLGSRSIAFGLIIPVAFVLSIIHVSRTARYVREELYREATANSAAREAVVYGFWLLVAVVLSYNALLAETRDGALFFVVAVVCSRVGFELYYRWPGRRPWHRRGWHFVEGESTDPFTYSATGSNAFRNEMAAFATVERPSGVPRMTAEPDRASITVSGSVTGITTPISHAQYVSYVLVGALTLAFVLEPQRWLLGTIAAVLGGLALAGLAREWLIHRTIRYEVYDDEIVCYDHWLEEPQWRLSADEIQCVSVRRTVVDRVLETGAVILETGDGETVPLEHLPEYESVATALDERVGDGRGSITINSRDA